MRLKRFISLKLLSLLICIWCFSLSGCAHDDIMSDNSMAEGTQEENYDESVEEIIEEIKDEIKEEIADEIQYPLLITPKSTKTIEFAIESEDIFCIYDGDNYGYIKMDDQEITGYIYEMAYPFSEGLACVRLEGKYGYIDDKGETVLPFIYDDAAPFSEGLAYYAKEGEYGFIKEDGTVAFQFECDSVSSFKDGLAYYSLGGKYGYIDCNGQIAIEAIYDDADYFIDGLARVTLDGYVGMINQYGEEVIPIAYDEISRGEEYLIATTGDKKEYYSFEGNAVLAGEESIDDVHYDDVRAIPDSDLYIAKKDELYGVIDAQGNNVVPFSYDGMNIAGDVKEVLLRVCKDNKYGCLEINTFTEMIPLEYDYMGLFTDGLAAVSKDGRYGIVKENGEMYVPVDYSYAYILDDGFFYLKKGEITELYNKNGELIFSDNILFISFYGDFFKIEKNDELQIIDKSGNMILSADYWYDMERIYGSYKNSVLKRGVDEQEQLLILDRNMDVDLSEILLKNSITPRIELYWNLTHGKQKVSVTNQDGTTTEIERFNTWDDWSYIKKFRLFDVNDSGKPILYTYEKPCIMPGFPMSDSAFWDIRDNQVVEILTGYECGGSMRGDYVCLWRDNETGEVLIGTWGAIGGFGGFAYYSYIYQYHDDNVERIAKFNDVSQDIRNYDEEELNQKAELFYAEDGIPCTKENIFENEYLDAYYFNDELVTAEIYKQEQARFVKLETP